MRNLERNPRCIPLKMRNFLAESGGGRENTEVCHEGRPIMPNGPVPDAPQVSSSKPGTSSSLTLHQPHSLRIPPHNSPALQAQIAQQRRARRAESEDSILHHRLPRPHRRKEILEVVVTVAVARRRNIFFVSNGRLSLRIRRRILLPVLVEIQLLGSLGEAANHEARFLLARRPAYTH